MKLLTCIVIVLIGILVMAGCMVFQVGGNSVEMKFGPWTYSCPEGFPGTFTKWQGQMNPLPVTPDFGLIIWEGCNPGDQEEWVMAIIAVEDASKDETIKGYIVGVTHTKSMKELVEGKGETVCFIDKQYIETGKPSFVLTKVKEIPNLKDFTAKKKIQFGKKVEI